MTKEDWAEIYCIFMAIGAVVAIFVGAVGCANWLLGVK
jgi:hypothetical protein